MIVTSGLGYNLKQKRGVRKGTPLPEYSFLIMVD